ncbi:unnamed protein product [Rotaria sp. Silwood1]|nr:unnamed protein product [Rotaria sp. Silwood1]
MDNVINTVSVKHINQNLSINSNAINKHQCSSTSIKNRRYKITVMHSDELFDIPSNQCKTLTESTKLPPIVPKKQSFQTKQTTSKINQLPSSSSITTKQIRKNIFSDFRNK